MNLGKILMTQGVAEWKEQSIYNSMFIYRSIERYINGDFGNLSEGDRALNEHAAQNEERVLASYDIEPDGKLWIITDDGHAVTTLLFPDEY
jgi:hypothetical protein